MHRHWSEWFSPQMKGLNPGRLKKSKSNSTPQNVEFTVKYTFHSSSPYNDDLTVTNNIKKSGTMRTQSHYGEVLRWDIFMEQELRFGLDLGRLGNF